VYPLDAAHLLTPRVNNKHVISILLVLNYMFVVLCVSCRAVSIQYLDIKQIPLRFYVFLVELIQLDYNFRVFCHWPY